MRKAILFLAACAVSVTPALSSAVSAEAAPVSAPTVALPSGATGIYKNCTALNKKYKHGLGKANARDKTSGKRVTNFKKSTKLYNIAMRNNRGLDRDKDGIACEKH